MEVSDGGERTKENGIGDSLVMFRGKGKVGALGLTSPPSAGVAELQQRRAGRRDLTLTDQIMTRTT